MYLHLHCILTVEPIGSEYVTRYWHKWKKKKSVPTGFIIRLTISNTYRCQGILWWLMTVHKTHNLQLTFWYENKIIFLMLCHRLWWIISMYLTAISVTIQNLFLTFMTMNPLCSLLNGLCIFLRFHHKEREEKRKEKET